MTVDIEEDLCRGFVLERDEYSNKGTCGHAMLITGSTGMMGAAVLSAGAALKSGCGLVSVHVPYAERQILHITQPSAVLDCDPSSCFSSVPQDLGKYSAIGVGCGLGRSSGSADALESLLRKIGEIRGKRPCLVLDADALNIVASRPPLFGMIPPGTVLTPHTKELQRLVCSACGSLIPEMAGFTPDDVVTWRYPWNGPVAESVAALADALDSVFVVKGHRTLVCPCRGVTLDTPLEYYAQAGACEHASGYAEGGTPVRICYVNTTGNAGMAKGGSGDILTGLLTGLAARGYTPLQAAVYAVWQHGRAGDSAALSHGKESMNASDILSSLRLD